MPRPATTAQECTYTRGSSPVLPMMQARIKLQVKIRRRGGTTKSLQKSPFFFFPLSLSFSLPSTCLQRHGNNQVNAHDNIKRPATPSTSRRLVYGQLRVTSTVKSPQSAVEYTKLGSSSKQLVILACNREKQQRQEQEREQEAGAAAWWPFATTANV